MDVYTWSKLVKQSPSFNSQNFVVPHVYFSSKFTVLNNCLPSKVISSLFLGWLFITVIDCNLTLVKLQEIPSHLHSETMWKSG